VSTAMSGQTRVSLLLRLKQAPQDNAAWQEFTRRYEPRILGWCRHWHVQEADAQDVAQTVLVQLTAKLQNFEYNPSGSFRGWLKTLTHHAWQKLILRRRQALTNLGQGESSDPLESLEARDDLQARLREAFDLEMMELAMERVQARVTPATWEAFRLTAVEDLSGTEAATRLGQTLMNIYKARSNVQKMLQEEVQRLEGEESP
jgi:RNA polymerase sigma factor (sigma-70 family)